MVANCKMLWLTWYFIDMSIVYRWICVHFLRLLTNICAKQRIHKSSLMWKNKYGWQIYKISVTHLTLHLHLEKLNDWKQGLYTSGHRFERTNMPANCKIFVSYKTVHRW